MLFIAVFLKDFWGMGQASILTDAEIKRVFRIIETTRNTTRNRVAFVLSIYAGLRVGEIAALAVGDVATSTGEVRRESSSLGIRQKDRMVEPSSYRTGSRLS
jgi:integrase